MARFNRSVSVSVRDGDNSLVQGSTIRWKEDGKDRGYIENSDGHGILIVLSEVTIIEVTSEYKSYKETGILAIDQNICNISFPQLRVMSKWKATEQHFPFIVGIIFVLIAMLLAFMFPNPSALQTRIVLAVLSLGGGAFATEISGMIEVNLSVGAKFVIGASGAAAVFVILYFAVPAN